MDDVDNRREVREFLASRRARITPQQAGLPLYGTKRRVPGLRREEVALLAGVSTDYYTRLEKGHLSGVSDAVLEAVARTLQLDDVERAHLFDLARAAHAAPARTSRRPASPRVRPSVQHVLDGMTGAAAFLRNGRLDMLTANQLGYALYAPVFGDRSRPANLARFGFLDPQAPEFYLDWDGIADAAVGSLRAEAGRAPDDRARTELVGQLALRSDEFRTRWAAHNVTYYRTGAQPFRHPHVGDLVLDDEALELPADPGQTIIAYTAGPGTPAAEKLTLLACWAAAVAEQRPTPHSVDDRPD